MQIQIWGGQLAWLKKSLGTQFRQIAKSLKPGIPPLAELLGYDQVTHTLGMSAF